MVDIPYHTHTFDIPTASEGEIRAGLEAGKAITPDRLFPVLADKADKATTLAGYGITDAATKEQGQKADTAVQPTQVSAVGFSGRYNDLLNKPDLGGSSALNVGATAGTVAAGDDARIVGAVQKATTVTAGTGLAGGGTLAANISLALSSTSLASLALADTAVQPTRKLSAGAGLTGGGDFSADRTVALNAASIASLGKADTSVQPARKIGAGAGLTGGGDFSADRTVALNAASISSLAKADSAVQPSDLGALAKKDTITTADISASGSADNDAILTRGGTWVKPTGVGDMLESTWKPVIDANTASRHMHANKTILDATTASYLAAEKAKLAGIPADADKTPALAAVATSGAYVDLSGLPAIPAAQVQTDWNAASGVSAIQNKPALGTASAQNVEAFATAAQGAKADKAVRFDAQALTAQEQGQARANIDAGNSSYNWIINGDFTINQRRGVKKPANGVYGFDRWKGHAGGIEQIIEALPAGEYTLTWSGGGNGTFGGQTKASPIKAAVTGGNTSVVVPQTATKVSLVAGDATAADPWLKCVRSDAIELILAMRYFEIGEVGPSGWYTESSGWDYLWPFIFKVSKRTTPSVTFTPQYPIDGATNPRIDGIENARFNYKVTASRAGTAFVAVNLKIDAEL